VEKYVKIYKPQMAIKYIIGALHAGYYNVYVIIIALHLQK
jgi:hypothetical protein